MARSKLSRARGAGSVFLASDAGHKAGFVVDDKAVEKLLVTPQAEAHLRQVLEVAQFHVRQAAPTKGRNKYATDDFKSSISVTVRKVLDAGPVNGAARTSVAAAHQRLVGFIYSYDPIWHLLEYGSANNPVMAPFARGLEAAGLQYQRTSKGGA